MLSQKHISGLAEEIQDQLCSSGTTIESVKDVIKKYILEQSRGNKKTPGFKSPKVYRKQVVLKCDECGDEFLRRADSVNKDLNFCSQKCSGINQGKTRKGVAIPSLRTGEDRICKICGANFYISGSTVKKGHGKFCSKNCLFEHQKLKGTVPKDFIASADNKGEKNGRYKHGNRVGKHIQKKELRNQIIQRDGDWCLICGKPSPGLHMHRIIYGSQGGKYEIDNCVQLCNIHHGEIHDSKKKWLKPLLEYIKTLDRNSITF